VDPLNRKTQKGLKGTGERGLEAREKFKEFLIVLKRILGAVEGVGKSWKVNLAKHLRTGPVPRTESADPPFTAFGSAGLPRSKETLIVAAGL